MPKAAGRLAAALAARHHGDMAWMADRPERRASPRLLWPAVRSIVLCGLSTPPAHDPIAALGAASHGLVATYAQGRDYHDVLKAKLKRMAQALLAGAGAGEAKVFVDTAAVMEKPLAAAAGLGWQGKHTVLVSRRHGSWMLLGALFTDLELAPDAPHADRCGSCRRCLDICPTDAFPAPYRLDARRCLAYLTIEHKGPIPRAFRRPLGNRVFGCDDCLAVCPWNRFAAAAREAALTARRDIGLRPLAELIALDDTAFRALFAKTPVKRTGRARFVRNALIAAGNAGPKAEAALSQAVRARLEDAEPLVRGAAVWALARLDPVACAHEAWRAERETDALVREEWAAEGFAAEGSGAAAARGPPKAAEPAADHVGEAVRS